MLYNNRGYTIEIPDDLYWSMTDEEFNEYIDSKFVESFNSPDSSNYGGTELPETSSSED